MQCCIGREDRGVTPTNSHVGRRPWHVESREGVAGRCHCPPLAHRSRRLTPCTMGQGEDTNPSPFQNEPFARRSGTPASCWQPWQALPARSRAVSRPRDCRQDGGVPDGTHFETGPYSSEARGWHAARAEHVWRRSIMSRVVPSCPEEALKGRVNPDSPLQGWIVAILLTQGSASLHPGL